MNAVELLMLVVFPLVGCYVGAWIMLLAIVEGCVLIDRPDLGVMLRRLGPWRVLTGVVRRSLHRG